MSVPPYCTTRSGKVFRVQRSSTFVGPDRVRYTLRAVPIQRSGEQPALEVARELDVGSIRDQIELRQAVATPEETFEQLWQQLRLDLDVHYG